MRIGAAGLCHSDLSVINGDRPRPLPMALGHEAAGVVEEVGEGVRDLARGDHVVMVFMPSCGHCLPCAEGRPALCEPGAAANGAGTLLSGARRLHCDGGRCEPPPRLLGLRRVRRGVAPLAGEDRPGAAARGGGAVRLRGADRGRRGGEHRARAGRRLGRGRRPRRRRPRVAARRAWRPARGAIVAVDLSDEKLGLARQLGATDTVNARDPDAAEQVREATGGGVEFAFEMAGSVRALELAYKITRRGGTTVTAGLPPPDAALPLPVVNLVGEERTVKGSYIGTCVPTRDIPRYVELYRRGRLPVDRLMSGRLALEEINEGFDRLHEGKAVRQVIELHG